MCLIQPIFASGTKILARIHRIALSISFSFFDLFKTKVEIFSFDEFPFNEL